MAPEQGPAAASTSSRSELMGRKTIRPGNPAAWRWFQGSCGPDTPRDFDPGLYRQEEVNLNFDVFSERMDLFADIFGLPYSQFTPWGLSGGYYYARLNYSWGR